MTERTPLTGTPVPQYDPQYVFSAGRVHRNRVRQFQCCVCATVLACFVLALIVTVAYSVNRDTDDSGNHTNSSVDDVLVNLLSLQFPLPDPEYVSWCDNDTSPAELEEALIIGQQGLEARDKAEEMGPHLLQDTPSYRHQMAVRTYPESTRLSRAGYILDVASRHLITRMNRTQRVVGRGPTVSADWMPEEACADDAPTPCPSNPYRTADGSCNNPVHPYKWGVAMRPFRRTLPPDYGDGISKPRVAKDGSALPSARDVSVTVHRPMYHDDSNFTVMLAVWGQFIDHDITATALTVAKGGGAISCCGEEAHHPECFPVLLDEGDPYFHQFNMTCMEFVRSAPAPMCTLGPREQLNQASAFLDGSVVYGPNLNLTTQLRAFQGGRLRMSLTPDGRTLLPYSSDPSDGCNEQEENAKGRYCFTSGDARANENLHLTTMHLLWARQHNLVADKLANLNPTWTDERVFQEARRIVVAQMQHITYSEFLPVLLGDELMSLLQLHPQDSGYFQDYDSTVDPTVANSFAAAAFRFAHTLLPGLMKMIRNGSEEYVELHRMLFNPYSLYNPGKLDATLKGALATQVERVDPYFTTELTEHLFARGAAPCGLDLVSLNIQRGRDHGLPPYPAWREKCGLSRPKSFSDMKEYIDSDSLRRMSELYMNVDDIDLYTGGLAERPIRGGFLGPTITCLLADQFVRLKHGDRFWYETSEYPQAFSEAQLRELRKSSLAKIVCDNADSVEFVQFQVMHAVGPENQRVPCSSIPEPDLSEWKELPRIELDSLVMKVRTMTTRLGGKVISGHVFSDGGKSLWSGTLPLAIPAKYNVRANWNGIIDGSTLEGIFSLPVYGRWLNGRFSFQLAISWNQSQSSEVSGSYMSPIYFKEVTQRINLTYKGVEFQEELSKDPSVPGEALPTAQIVLEGAFSMDQKVFWWNGGFVFTAPRMELPALDSSTKSTTALWNDLEGTVISGSVTSPGEKTFILGNQTLSFKVATPMIIQWKGSINRNSSDNIAVQGKVADKYFLLYIKVSTPLNISLSGGFRSPVYFLHADDRMNLHNEIKSVDLTTVSSDDAEFCNCTEVPIMLLGTFSEDRNEFFWPGNVVIQIQNE